MLKLYGHNVIKPVLRKQRLLAEPSNRRFFYRVGKLLTREDIKFDKLKSQRLENVLLQSPVIQTVYDFKQKLKAIWIKSSKDQVRLAQRLQTWCHEAEASGIKVLQEFSYYLRGYALQSR